jgi:hypothetical protein
VGVGVLAAGVFTPPPHATATAIKIPIGIARRARITTTPPS